MRIHYPLFAILVAITACSDASGPSGRRGIQFLSGANVTDSAGAILTEALVVEVRDSAGALAPSGTVVRFTAVPIPEGFSTEAFVQSLTSTFFTSFATGTTDDAGRTGVLVRLGFRAGSARIVVSAPTMNVTDTARFTIVPASASRAAVSPLDTVLYVGRTYTLRGGVTDQFGNPRDDPVTWTTSGSGISVTNAGVVTASAEGRYSITANSPVGSATGFVSVVPQARLVAWRQDFINASRIVTLDLDGSNVTELTQASNGVETHPMWIAGSNNIVFTASNATNQWIRKIDQNGTVTDFLSSKPPTMSNHFEPTPSANGEWVYFSALDSQCSTQFYCLYRAKADGSGAELLGNLIGQGTLSWRPAPSPDGSKVAFVTSSGSGATIKVFDVTASTVSSWSVLGQTPSWSPDGTLIAYTTNFGGPIRLVNADGTGSRALTGSTRSYPERLLSWSADSKWILARSFAGTLDLIEVSTGAVLPLPYSSRLEVASLK